MLLVHDVVHEAYSTDVCPRRHPRQLSQYLPHPMTCYSCTATLGQLSLGKLRRRERHRQRDVERGYDSEDSEDASYELQHPRYAPDVLSAS